MAIATYSSFQSKECTPYQRLQDTKASLTTVAGRLSSMWLVAPDPGVAPTTAVVPTRATTGALGQSDSTGTQRIVQVAISIQNAGYIIIADRLSHQGGLSAIVTGAQTTNFPTAALTRATSGVGVMIGIEIYTAIGVASTTTISASYTNQSGTSGQTTPDTIFGGGGGFNAASRFIILPFQAGDSGVQSVQSVNVVATTGTAGNFGVTLFKPIFALPVPNLGSQQFLFDAFLNLGANLPPIENGACLFYLVNANMASTGVMLTATRLVED